MIITEEIHEVGCCLYKTTRACVTNLQTIHGCDSIVTVDLTVYPVYDQAQVIEICAGASYGVGDSVYTETGVYGTLMETIDGCDSLVTLDLTVHPVYAPSIAAEICDGDTYTVGTTGYTTTGVWVTNLQTVEGCDSIVTLDLTVYPVYSIGLTETICDGETYEVGGFVYTTTGSWVTNLQTIHGCDSIVTVDSTVYPVYDQTQVIAICAGASYRCLLFSAYDSVEPTC